MLVLSRKSGERLCIAGNIEVTVISVTGNRVRLGFNAPDSVSIHRGEIQQRINQEQSADYQAAVPPTATIQGATPCPTQLSSSFVRSADVDC